ncbi:TMEM33 domain-containing protein [Plasmodium brasilianum]|uniref:TMEM33 domain-containing protein n=1 Tax=Plasmodium brasilianum TaxID=5824 RepID=A0ACB9YGB8_PLABR|nr:TMEM33 domain-containing protein [Plasmodium brasilianum]
MKNLTEAEQKYLNHDWVNDKKWKLYLSNLYPSPSMNNMEKYKKKYFQKNIDNNLDINTNFDSNNNSHNSQNSFNSYNNNNNNNMREQKQETSNFYSHNTNFYNNIGQLPVFIFFYCTFVLCTSLFYFIILSLNLSLYKKIGTFMSLSYFFAFLSLLFLEYKTQKQNFSLLQFFSSEKGHYLSYSLILFFIKDAILNVYMMRANVEIYNLLFIIICLFLKRASLLNLIIYMHFFKLKYSSSDSYFHACYSKNGEMIRQCLSHPMVPKIFLTLFNKVSHYLNVYLSYRRG